MPGRRLPLPRRPPRWAQAALLSGVLLSGGCPQAEAAGLVMAVNSIDQTISNLTAWIVGLLAGLATLFLTVGGLRYMMAGGDPGEVEKAKGALRSACAGYLLAMLAPVILGVLKSLVGA
jgi:hypothetical protein